MSENEGNLIYGNEVARDTRQQLEHDINRLKDPEIYKREYRNPEVQQLVQALDILTRLRQEVHGDSSQIPWTKLFHAVQHVDALLRKHLDESKQEK